MRSSALEPKLEATTHKIAVAAHPLNVTSAFYLFTGKEAAQLQKWTGKQFRLLNKAV
jgi:hypothetical protein